MKPQDLTLQQRSVAIQRLTALWAFSESGLGGVLHALQIPFTGLVVGGLSVVLISFIAAFAQKEYAQILKSLIVVVLVKAAVSPHTPFPAYVAVSFQACLGYLLFRFLRIHLFSILLLSILAMLESAAQKLLLVTLFFGGSFWKAADEMVAFISKQFGTSVANGSSWLIAVYTAIYLAGGIIIGFTAWHLLKNFSVDNKPTYHHVQGAMPAVEKKSGRKKKIVLLLFVAVLLSVVLYFLNPVKNSAYTTFKAVLWTTTAILLWYGLVAPALTQVLHGLLQKHKSRYSQSFGEALSFLPVLHQLTKQAWQVSKGNRPLQRIPFFLKTLVSYSITYTEGEKRP